MVNIHPFGVEAWMDKYENHCKYNIAETCCASISLDQLQELSEDKGRPLLQTAKTLNYGAIRGSDALRENLARLYSAKGNILSPERIVTTPGAISANYLCAYALVGAGDHVICHYPTCIPPTLLGRRSILMCEDQSLYEVPRQLGAEVDLWRAKPEEGWALQIEDLKRLIKPNTKLIIINNPQNPTGAVLKKSVLQGIIDVAAEHDITIMSDEVYRPLFHSINPIDSEFPPSLISMGYKKAVVTGSMSKAYALAGIRVGWVASRDPEIVERIAEARHYTTISVSQLDEQVAAYALHPNTVHSLLARNIQLAKTNLALMERFMIKNDDACEWVKPLAGTTAFVKVHREGKPVDSVDFCEKLLEKTGVMFVPGSQCFGEEFKGYVRIGFVNHTETVKEGLDKATQFIRKNLDDVKLAE
ncbi:PLP-dependent transferase [Westerdykella ornata]|uniref:PLP-dependent transferase n=1 Tax=Westerdykella ornata TaxID=318751 RepID=A0A6A6JSG9_WESOR|nr:PLP-dependent transferase [Westerdykella ornata]KAF2279540.1 PLP-dependent transferase [Westerdykella ornata]